MRSELGRSWRFSQPDELNRLSEAKTLCNTHTISLGIHKKCCAKRRRGRFQSHHFRALSLVSSHFQSWIVPVLSPHISKFRKPSHAEHSASIEYSHFNQPGSLAWQESIAIGLNLHFSLKLTEGKKRREKPEKQQWAAENSST